MLSLVATSARALLLISVAGAPIGQPITPATVVEAAVATGSERPFSSLSEAQLAELIRKDIGSLGSLSVGAPNRGQLIAGVPLEDDEFFHVVHPEAAYGTEETIFYLKRAIQQVHTAFPNTPRLYVGHLSREGGGYLSPHKSHQSGRDVDLGFFYKGGENWYRVGTPQNLDLPRNWTLVRALITDTDVEMIFVASYIQRMLESYAISQGEDPAWLEAVFRGTSGRPPLLRHAPGHANHFHVRFYCPFAERAARAAYPTLVASGTLQPISNVTFHRAKKGETLGMLAKRYGTTVQAIQRENGLRGTVIQAKRTYRIPRPYSAAPRPPSQPLPARHAAPARVPLKK